MLLAAAAARSARRAGPVVAQTVPFRDKEKMKQVLDAAGDPHAEALSPATSVAQCWEAAERIGFPIILKPIAGAGSADTYRVERRRRAARRAAAPAPRADGERRRVRRRRGVHLRHGHDRRPHRVLQHRVVPPAPADRAQQRMDQPAGDRAARRGAAGARRRREDGSRGDPRARLSRRLHAHGVVSQGERRSRVRRDRRASARRAPGRPDELRLRLRRVPRVGQRRHPRPLRRDASSAATTWRRSTSARRAQGRIRAIEGLGELQRKFGDAIVANTLLPVGTPRRNWKQTLVSDGFIMLRHPELGTTLEMADEVGTKLNLYAG